MRIVALFIVLLSFQGTAIAGQKTNRFEMAKQAHLEKRFTDAIDLLNKEIKAQPNNPAIYFNLGLAYKAEKQFPKAIWAFEKTLKLQPKDSEAIQLIEASYAEMDSNLTWQDETGTFQRALIALGSNFWSILTIILSLVTALVIVLAKRSKKNNQRKWFIGTAVFSIITLIVCLANATASYNYENNHDYAIVLDNLELQNSKLPKEVISKKIQAGSKVKLESWNKDGSASIQALGKTIKVKKGLARI